MGILRRLCNVTKLDTQKKRRLLCGALAILCAVTAVVSAISPARVYAYTHTFDNGGQVTVSDDGNTITGIGELVDGHLEGTYPHSSYVGTFVLPDGMRLEARCYEAWLGKPDHWNISGPCDGAYSFTANKQPDGSYFIVIHSENAAGPVPGATPSPDKPYQRVYTQFWQPTLTVDVNFTKTSADLKITNSNAEYSLAGAQYEIYERDDTYVTTITTDANGHADYKLKPNTNYYAVETVAPQGYKLNTEKIYFSTGNITSNEQLVDEPGSITLTVNKKDSTTGGAPQVGATLAGAEYKVVSLSTPGWEATGTTDENGKLRIEDIPAGKITVTETKAPQGYKLDETVHEYEIHANETVIADPYELTPEDDFKENPIAFDIEIAKFTDEDEKDESGGEMSGQEKPAAGIQFQIISNTTNKVVGTLTTGKDGFAATFNADTVNAKATSDTATDDATKPWMGDGKRVDGIDGALPYDKAGYTIHEVVDTIPDGFGHVEDWTISANEIANGVKLRYIIDDHVLTTRLAINKVDAESGGLVQLAGFTFQILDENKQPISQTVWYPNRVDITEFTTDNTGSVTLPERLRKGTYYIHEVKAQAPYLLGEDVKFEVTDRAANMDPITVVEMADPQAKGRATLVKVDKTEIGDNGANADFESHETTAGLAGAEFDVVAKERIVTPDNVIHAVEGEVVDHVVTDENGRATTKELYLGSGTAKYAFVETKAPAGHVLDTTEHEFTLEYKDDKTAIVETEVEIDNKPTEQVIKKIDAEDSHALEGATFNAWNVNDQVSIDTSFAGYGLGIRANGATTMSLTGSLPVSTLKMAAIEVDTHMIAINEMGVEFDLADINVSLNPGQYRIVKVVGANQREEVATFTAEARHSYEMAADGAIVDSGLQDEVTVDMAYDEEQDIFAMPSSPGTYKLTVDGTDVGEVEVKDEGAIDNLTFYEIVDGAVANRRMLLKPGVEVREMTSDRDGLAHLYHMHEGTYRFIETKAPEGYTASENIIEFTVEADDTSNSSNIIEVANSKTPVTSLDQTGALPVGILFASAGAVIAGCAGILGYYNRKDKKRKAFNR